jgi:hypothetical protein
VPRSEELGPVRHVDGAAACVRRDRRRDSITGGGTVVDTHSGLRRPRLAFTVTVVQR